MYTSELMPGFPIELIVHGSNNSYISLYSSIVDVNDDAILIEKLEHEGKLIGIPANCNVDMLYINPDSDRPYIWKNVLTKAVRHKKEIYHCITQVDEEGKPTNRRQSFRLFIGEEMPLIVHSADGTKRYKVILKDISETGMSFISSEKFPLQKMVRIVFEDRNFSVPLSGSIVRVTPQPERESLSIYGCHFSEPNHLLGKYITKKQQEMLQAQRS